LNASKVSNKMKKSIGDRFDGRLKSASEAKKDRLERFKAAAVDPEKLAQRAERQAAAAAREEKRKAKAAKQRQEKEELQRQKAEAAALAKAEADAAEKEAAVQDVDQEAALEAERKAKRDRRYAARQNRKR
jgi:hypothetical protein